MAEAYLALGSNLGEPLETFRRAHRDLATLGHVTAASSLWRTAPVGGPPDQPDYLNAVVVLEPITDDPEALLRGLLALEAAQGRVRTVRWGARTLDLDLLAWNDLVFHSDSLTLPHPRMLARPFVLAPLCEVAPAWTHPVTGAAACDVLRALGLKGVARTDLRWDGLP